VRLFVTLDRDYRSDEHIAEITGAMNDAGIESHIWRRKELESYLLEPQALARAARLSVDKVVEILRSQAELAKTYVVSRMQDCESRRAWEAKASTADAMKSVLEYVQSNWDTATFAIHRSPAKELLRGFNRQVISEGGRTVGARQLAGELRLPEIDAEVVAWIRAMEGALSDH
jgi:hypothetical protein